MKKKYLKLGVFIICCMCFSFANFTHKGTLYWQERSLTWQDFKYTPKVKSINAAHTVSGIEISFPNGDKNTLKMDVFTFFNKEKSWRKEKNPSNELLDHEQRHFDIDEIMARKLRKRILDTVITNRNTSQRIITFLFNKINKEAEQYQHQYDLETNYSVNRNAQEEWDKRIEMELKQLEGYSDPRITIEF